MYWDNDLNPDLLIGDGGGDPPDTGRGWAGCIWIFLNTGTNVTGTPILATTTTPVQADTDNDGDDEDLCMGSGRAQPVYEDWDGDGYKDIVVGNIDAGDIDILLNDGDETFTYSATETNRLALTGWNETRSAPRIVDWNEDGLKDLLVGELAGYVWYFENTTADATTTPFVFNAPEKLLLADGVTEVRFISAAIPTAPRSRLFVTDWNGDGKKDLILGGYDGTLQLFLASDVTLVVDIIGGSGTVTDAGPTNINCPGDCSQSYSDAGENVTLTATATTTPGYTFNRWIGCETINSNQCVQNVNSLYETVTASFIPASVHKSVAFGRVNIGLNAQILLTITNSGTSTNLLVGTVSNGEDLNAPFSVTSEANCEDVALAPGGSCTMTAEFNPVSSGSFRDSFTIGDGAITIAMTGEGISSGAASDPDITVFPTNMNDFMNKATSTVQYATSTIYNFGGGELDIDQITVSDTDRYSVPGGSDNCSNSTVSVSATCTVAVMYTALPAAAGGPHMATLSIPSDDPDEDIVRVGLIGSTIGAGNTAPTQPSGTSPANGATVSGTGFVLTWTDATSTEATLTHTRYIGTDPSLATSTLLAAAEIEGLSNGVRSGRNHLYAGYAGYPAVLIGIVIAGGFSRKRKRIGLFMAAVIITGGLLFNSCGGGGGSGSPGLATGATAASGTTYYWKVVADDGQGGVNESDVYSFTTQ